MKHEKINIGCRKDVYKRQVLAVDHSSFRHPSLVPTLSVSPGSHWGQPRCCSHAPGAKAPRNNNAMQCSGSILKSEQVELVLKKKGGTVLCHSLYTIPTATSYIDVGRTIVWMMLLCSKVRFWVMIHYKTRKLIWRRRHCLLLFLWGRT